MDCINGVVERVGPEATLVREFVRSGLPQGHSQEQRFTFIEPRIERARPDVVVVYWDSSVAESWPLERQALKKIDLRLAHYLYLAGPVGEDEIKTVFPQNPIRLLDRLDQAGMVSKSGAVWQLNRLEQVFAVRRIVAFEAKISALSRAIGQAVRNTWFASESYVLTTTVHPSAPILQRACDLGVGLLVSTGDSPLISLADAKPYRVPQSYASWLFNELTWKASIGAIAGVS